MPINAATRRYYTGINVLILWSARDEHGFPSPQWMTFKQALDKGAYVRKGEKGTPVIFAKKLTFNEGDEDERKIFMHLLFYRLQCRTDRGASQRRSTRDRNVRERDKYLCRVNIGRYLYRWRQGI